MITLEIPGEPFAKQRPRATKKGHIYTPGKTVSFERQVGQIAMPKFPKPLEGPVRLVVHATFGVRKSWSKKETAEKINRPHVQKPDGDNLLKAICDGLNRIAWADDGQVADKRIVKMWGARSGTVVHIEQI